MKITADTSVIVASFASWHEQHDIAVEAMTRIDGVIAHTLIETYSVLTRLPAPHRMAADVVANYLRLAFEKLAMVALPPTEYRKLVASCAARCLSGGAVYDALFAGACLGVGARLLTLDARPRTAYALVGVDHELLS